MPDKSDLRQLMESDLFQKDYRECDADGNPAALPEASLEFLIALAQQMKARSIFEFGSGRSTAAFLRHGFSVTSVEDTAYWMEQTRQKLSDEERSRHIALVHPLKLRFHGLFPVMDWAIDADLQARLRSADFVLIDSPYYAPFRESTLWSALIHCDYAVIVLDDTRIPTLSHFCDRLAQQNPDLPHRRVRVGHTFDIFGRGAGVSPRFHHGPLEIVKGWRRFVLSKIRVT